MEKITLEGAGSRILELKTFPQGWRAGRVFLRTPWQAGQQAVLGKDALPVFAAGTPFSPAVYELTDALLEAGTRAVLTLTGIPEGAEKPYLSFTRQTFLDGPAVLGGKEGLTVRFFVHAKDTYRGQIRIRSEIFQKPLTAGIACGAGDHRLQFFLPWENLVPGTERWDLGQGRLHTLTLEGEHLEPCSSTFGIRELSSDGTGHLLVNGRRVFLVGETNAGLSPASSGKSWDEIFAFLGRCGINLLRFAGRVPGEEALFAADRAGFAILAELPGAQGRFDREMAKSQLSALLRSAGVHPSLFFVSLGTGLSLHETSVKEARDLLEDARRQNHQILFAASTDPEAGRGGPLAGDDFFCSTGYQDLPLRDTGREEKPTYDGVLERIRTHFGGPVLSMDAGRFALLPPLPQEKERRESREADLFARMVETAGLTETWEKNRSAGLFSSLLFRREEAERALRTKSLAGIVFRGLFDEPGEVMPTTGLYTGRLQRKQGSPAPEEIARALAPTRLLILADRRCILEGETLSLRCGMANFGKERITGPWEIRLLGEKGSVLAAFPGMEDADCPAGGLTLLGDELIPIETKHTARMLTLELSAAGATARERIWIYPRFDEEGGEVVLTEDPKEALAALERGAAVLLSPPAVPLHFPAAAPLAAAPWYGPFVREKIPEETMGIRVDRTHPLFQDFVTAGYADWQWRDILAGAKAMVVPRSIPDAASLISAIDGPFGMRRLSALLFLEISGGKLLLSSLGLLQKKDRPEVRALLHGMCSFLQSPDAVPAARIDPAELAKLVQ